MFNARKLLALAAISTLLGTAVIVEDADARAGRSRSGGYSSFGARGNRTFDNGGMQGIQRTRQNNNQSFANRNNGAMANRPSFFQRHPILSGMMGALGGMALFSAMSHMFGGFGAGMGGLGGLMGLLLLGGLAFLAFKLLRNRFQPALAANGQSNPFGMNQLNQPSAFGPTVTDIGGYRQTKEQGLAAIALNNPGFKTEGTEDQLSGIFFRIQEAWSADDRKVLREQTTPEIFDYFSEDLDAANAKGERNILKNIVMRSFDLSEAWTEGDDEYISVKIYARLVDYVEKNGQIIEGSATEPTEFREVWTFARERGEQNWKLSAVNQH